jgi:hypothetical protein
MEYYSSLINETLTTNSNSGLNKEDYYDTDPLIKTNIILSSASLLGSLTIILLFCLSKRLKSFVFQLVFFLSISETVNSIGNIMSVHKLYSKESQNVCEIQAVIINYTDFCTLIWMCIISYTIYDLMINYNHLVSSKKKYFLFLGFGCPLIITGVQAIIFFTSDSHSIDYDKVGECWCWIFDINSNWIFVIIIYCLYWVLIIGNLLVILSVVKVLNSCCETKDENCQRIKKMVRKLYTYPLVSAFCFTFATIHRMYQIFYIMNSNNKPGPEAYRLEIILYLLHGMFISFRGFIYFLLYGCDKKVKSEMKYLAARLQSCLFGRESEWLLRDSKEDKGDVM